MFNHKDFIREFAEIVPEVKTALEVDCYSGELTDALISRGIKTGGISLESQTKGTLIGDIRTVEMDEKYDLVFSSGLLEHFNLDEIVDVIEKMKKLSEKYILNFVPNSSCLAYKNAKKIEKTVWKDELDFSVDELAGLHAQAGLNIVKTGYSGAEWAKLFGPEPSAPYLVWCLCEIPPVQSEKETSAKPKSRKKSA